MSAPRSGPYTVKDCLDDYVEWMGEKRKSSADARYRANGIIIPDLGDIDCEKLTADRIKRWLHAAAKKPPRLRSKNGEPQKYRVLHNDDESKRRRQATLNRTLTVLKAALNRAWRDKKISSDSEWRRVEPFEAVDGARPRYLKVEEAKRLLNASPLAFRRLVQAALATGARYGELAVLNVNDFNSDSDTLHIRTSKSGKGRHVYLTTEGVSLFGALTAGRSADEPLLVKDDGSRWATSHQIRPMKEACAAAKVKGATFHCLRHTYASLAIMNDAPLFVVAKNLGHADTRMVEKHYGHLASSYMADAIRAGAPRFGFKLDKKVVELRPGK
ncbi:MAG: site-specific integrase [Rhizomicrobium sp.]